MAWSSSHSRQSQSSKRVVKLVKHEISIPAPRLLPFFMAQFTGAGGRLVRGRLSSLTSDDLPTCDVLVNCSGLGARDLAGDQTMQPLRGQVSRVRAPWARKIILDDRF